MKYKEKKFFSYLKNIIFHNNFFLFYIVLFFSFFKKYQYLPSLKFPHSITLLNGNIFIIHENGIHIYDSSLTNLINSSYNQNGLISHGILSKIVIERFSEDDNGYIISIIDKTIFFFDYEGKLLIKKLKNKLDGEYYILVPIRKNNNEYFFMIGFMNWQINLLFFKFDNNDIILNKTINLTYSNIYQNTNSDNYDILKTGLSCQLMSDSINQGIIVCFIVIGSNPKKLGTFLINPITYEIDKTKSKYYVDIDLLDNDIKVIKSITTLDKKNL